MNTPRVWTAGLAVLLTACERAPMDATTHLERDGDAARWANTVQHTANPSCTHRWATRNTLVVRYKALSAGNFTLSGRISGVRPDPDATNDVASVSFARP